MVAGAKNAEAALQAIMRSWLESVEIDKRPKALADMLLEESFEDILKSDRWRPNDFGQIWREWRTVEDELSAAERSALWDARWRILAPLFDESLSELVEQNVKKARKEFALAQPAEVRELREKAKASEGRRLVNQVYLLALGTILALVGLAVWRGWSEKPEVTVEFNVGEIIAGVLVGTGAMTAGAAYALRQTERREQ